MCLTDPFCPLNSFHQLIRPWGPRRYVSVMSNLVPMARAGLSGFRATFASRLDFAKTESMVLRVLFRPNPASLPSSLP
jgi:hypothetical protein